MKEWLKKIIRIFNNEPDPEDHSKITIIDQSGKRRSFMPFRGKRSTMINRNIILKKGEIFFEIPEEGIGTGAGNIVMGDGVTPYKDLPYFIEGNKGVKTKEKILRVSSTLLGFEHDTFGNSTALIKEINFVDEYGNYIETEEKTIITKEEFIKCYNEWIVKDKMHKGEI